MIKWNINTFFERGLDKTLFHISWKLISKEKHGTNLIKNQCQLWARNKYRLSHSVIFTMRFIFVKNEEGGAESGSRDDWPCLPDPRTQGSGLQCLSAYLGLFQKESDRCWAQGLYALVILSLWSGFQEEDLIAKTRDLLDRHRIPTCDIQRYWEETPMRLWHEALISRLPRPRLLGQHRECCALRGNGWEQKACDGGLSFP